jgi:hypothetical protein
MAVLARAGQRKALLAARRTDAVADELAGHHDRIDVD